MSIISAISSSASRGPFITQWTTTFAGVSTSTQIKIPTISGTTYRCWVDWGDGTKSSLITTFNNAQWTHTYSLSGTYTVKIYGEFGMGFNNGEDKLKIINVLQWGTLNISQSYALFSGCTNLTYISAIDVPNLNYPNLSLASMFQSCPVRYVRNIESWNTSSVVSMASMFYSATAFNQNIGAWNTAAVTDMSNMLRIASVFNQNIGAWNTGAVTNMSAMFRSAAAFNQNIGAWNTSAVTNMQAMFLTANVFNQNIGGWNTSAVTNMQQMFQLAIAFNQNIGGWNVTNVANASSMFVSATLSKANYNCLLAGWGAQTCKSGVTFSGGNSHYDAVTGTCNGTAGRTILTGIYSWTITDGGTP